MKVLFTVNLENSHAPDADLLQAFVSDAVQSFATRTNARADVEHVRLFADEFDPLAEYFERRKDKSRRYVNYPRPGKPS